MNFTKIFNIIAAAQAVVEIAKQVKGIIKTKKTETVEVKAETKTE